MKENLFEGKKKGASRKEKYVLFSKISAYLKSVFIYYDLFAHLQIVSDIYHFCTLNVGH